MLYAFTLPSSALISPNRMLRLHYRARARARNQLAWTVLAALGRRPIEPIAFAKVTITRHAPRLLDADNCTGAAKLLLDVLQPASTRHPSGLGVIASDAADRLEMTVRQAACPAKDARVEVEICESGSCC